MNQVPGSAGKRLVPGAPELYPYLPGALVSFVSEVGGHGALPSRLQTGS